MARELAIVLVNGSISSTVALSLAAQRHRPIAVFAESTSPANSRVVQAVDDVAAAAKAYRVHRLPAGLALGKSDARPAGTAEPRGRDATVAALLDLLPILGAGLRLAAHHHATALYLGHRVGNDADAIARITEYAQIWSELVQVPCDRPNLEIMMPLLELDAWQVIDLGVQVDAPLGLAWSCYGGGNEPCGSCAGCVARDAAFVRSGRPDPQKPAASTRAMR